MNANKVENLNDNKSDYKNENIYSNNNNIKKNDVDNNKNDLSCSSMNEVYESVIEEKSQLENENFENINEDEKNVESQKNVINLRYLNNRFIGKNESIDILRYRNDKLGILSDNKSENIDLKKSTINKIINDKNINNFNCSNINIIINKGKNLYKNKKDVSSNLDSIEENNKGFKIDNSSLSNHSIQTKLNKEKENENNKSYEKEVELNKSDIDKKISNDNNGNNSDDQLINKKSDNINENKEIDNKNSSINDNEDINKNLNINEVYEMNNNIKNEGNIEETNKKFQKSKIFNNSILTSNLGMNNLNDFDSVTIIPKRKKKGLKNTNVSISKLSNSYNDNSSFLSVVNSILIDTIIFEGINNDEIDLDFLNSLRTIPIKYKNKDQKKYLKTLLELQHFFIDDSAIRVIKISEDGKYLSAGMQNGSIKLFDIIGYDYTKFKETYNKKTIMNYLNFITEKPFKILNGHSEDIIDLSWSTFFPNLLLSCSVDKFVILWDVNLPGEKCEIKVFDHGNIVTCVSFSPTDKYIFASGCSDKFIRIWTFKDILYKANNNNNENKLQEGPKIIDSDLNNINKLKKYIFQYFNIEDKITALSFFPTGDKIAVGTHNGKINIYEIRADNCFYKGNFYCKNRVGKKITSIEFINKNEGVITSSDSRIRLISMSDGKIIHKYKGYINEESWIKSCIDYNYDVIFSGSEDGFCYAWNIYSEEKKNVNYEFFKPYSQEKINASLIVPEKCYCNFLKKIMNITHKLLVTSIIINGTNKGRIQILLNIDDAEKY